MEHLKPIWPLLFPLLLVLLSIRLAYKTRPWAQDDEFEKWFCIIPWPIVTIFLGIMASGLGYGLGRIIGDSSDCIWHRCWSAKIVSMRGADGVQGKISSSLFMLVGQVGSRQVYHYYTQNRDGSIQPRSWTVDDDTSLFEENRMDGEVIQFDTAFKRSWVDWIGTPNNRLKMEFHIPAGMLKRSFEIK